MKMNVKGITVSPKIAPVLEPGFIPLGLFNQSYLEKAKLPFSLALVRGEGETARCDTFVIGTAESFEADMLYLEKKVKTLLWMKGGYELLLQGPEKLCRSLEKLFSAQGKRAFDAAFMSRVYERPFEIKTVSALPSEQKNPQALGRHLEGCRIGFDAGGSDRKVSAVIDGTPVYSEEVVWFPKLNSDPKYHYEGILSAFRSAAAHMPRVDAIGVSSAGIFRDNRAMVASLFLKVPEEAFNKEVKDIYIRAAKAMGDVPVVVCNDGDVTALAGAMSLERDNVLGVAMGTSEAAGFVDKAGNITGYLNELAFVPVDLDPEAMEDEWSGDIGCGVKYFSQDGVIKLAALAGIPLDKNASPAEKLKAVQALAEAGDEKAERVFLDTGICLGHTLPFYFDLYGFTSVLLLGRVLSGKGGELLVKEAKRVLKEEYPAVNEKIELLLPDEKARRVGQSVAAASLPERRA